MKTLRTLSVLILVAAFCTFSLGQDAAGKTKNEEAKPAESYSALLKKLKDGDSSIDFQALRFAFAETDEYSPYGCKDREMFKNLNEKKFKEALKSANTLLEKCYVSIDSHYVATIANRELKNEKEYEAHRKIYVGLVDSIIKKGDGKSMKTAWTVISVDEEYAVLSVLGYRRTSQALMNKEGSRYDVLDAYDLDDESNKTKFYFNIDIVFKGYGKMFSK